MSKAMQLKARIKNLAVKNQIPAQAVLQSFMMECLLERISLSKHKEKFILKGGMLIASLVGIEHRTTMDMDATLRGYPLSQEVIEVALSDICELHTDDGVFFRLDNIESIREEDEYGGYRAGVTAIFELITTPLKIDITAGDVITPHPIRYNYRSVFDDKVIEVWAYNLETILAEKVETILRRSVYNTRPRDFYDVYIIMKTHQNLVDISIFKTALYATAERRSSTRVLESKDEIINIIYSDENMSQRWNRYSQENNYAKDIKFIDVIETLVGLLN